MLPHESVKFLLVDDSEENLLALEGLLRRDGLELFKARSGTDALELLLLHDFALALLDVQMPEMDGFELAELMRGTERTRRTPIIFLTAVATDEGRRFRGYDTGAVAYLFKPVDPQMLKNKAEVFYEVDRQRRELSRQRDDLRTSKERLAEAMDRIKAHDDNSPLAIVELDADLRLMAWSKGAERMFGWGHAEVIGRRVHDLPWIHANDLGGLAALQMLKQGSRRGVHVHRAFRKDGQAIECEWYSSALVDKGGNIISINAQILDITERKRAEETQRLLIGELNHRVKNMLATVQAIATQTLRHNSNPADFSVSFSGRIQSLARAHSLLSNTTWRGADFGELIEDQLRLGTIEDGRLVATGPAVYLAPQSALHLALILHELATNATKYGGLSCPSGRITLNWTVDDGMLRLTWTEHGGPPVRAPSRRGFGTTLINHSVKAEGGEAHATYRADGLTWEITIALPSMSRRTDPVSDVLGSDRQYAQAAHAHLAEGAPETLVGRRFLVIEDEPLVALEIAGILQDAGAVVLGPIATIEEAIKSIESSACDGALLDGNLCGREVDAVAAALARRHIPFIFVSGYRADNLPRAFSSTPVLSKPFNPGELIEVACRLVRPDAEVVRLRK
jgi:PAS domain S-box-containing protein